MNIPSGYSDAKVLQKRRDHIIYRARNESSQTVVLKVTTADGGQQTAANAKLVHEFNVLRGLESNFFLQPRELTALEAARVLVCDNAEGIWLEQAIEDARFDMPGFLHFALTLADAVDALHQRQVVHNAINPSNILYDVAGKRLKICNLGSASLLSHETADMQRSFHPDAALPYISPEQTGRMNRSVDYRSDYYAMGVVFYQILLGTPPFQSNDPLELVHCHIARIPIPPVMQNNEIPEAISEIVMKLLAKNAEDRYQSISGLKHDLDECLVQWTRSGNISGFPLARHDSFESFQIPQKLYGRKREVEKLSHIFDAAAGGSTRFATISGSSGSGKTVLVNEIYKPLTRYRGFFLSGKFDQFNRDVPYFSIIEALQTLIKQLLAEGEEHWKSRILEAVGNNAAVITNVLPELSYIIGEVPPVQPLPAQESQNRFHRVFSDFLALFATTEHPMVLFLDDLQWADHASLKLILELLSENRAMSLLLVGAYRDSHVDATHPLFTMFRDLEERLIPHTHLRLEPLAPEDVNQLLADTLHHPIDDVNDLSALIYEKTNGNPFFVKQFLEDLHTKKLLTFATSKERGWKWDAAAIRKLAITDNVIQLMTEKLELLPDESHELLKLAACAGNTFNLQTLSLITSMDVGKCAGQLWPALRQGLIVPASDSYRYIEEREDTHSSSLDTRVEYRFLHDRVQQAAYAGLDAARKKQTHFTIGSLLKRNTSSDQIEESVFDIIHHLNQGREIISSDSDRLDLVRLNRIAGEKARKSAAFEAAYQYFSTACSLLQPDDWDTQYDLCWHLFSELSEAAYIVGRFSEAEEHFNLLIGHTRTDIEKARIFTTKVKLYTHINKVHEALETGFQAAKLLAIDLPAQPGKMDVAREYMKVKARLLTRKTALLQDLPVMTNDRGKAGIELLSQMTTTAYFHGPEMIGLLNLRMMRLVLEYGNPESASFVYSQYALIEGAGLGAYATAYEFGKLAMTLADRTNRTYWKCKTYLTMGAIVNHWRQPLHTTLPILKDAFHAAIDSGDLLYSIYANGFTIHTKITMGVPLPGLMDEIERFIEYSTKIRHVSFDLADYRRMLHILSGEAAKSGSAIAGASLEDIRAAKNLSAEINHHICGLKTAYFSSDFEQACLIADQALPVLQGAFGQAMEVEYRFFTALSLLAVYENSEGNRRPGLLKKFKPHLKKIEKWAANCPENFQPHFLLLSAEYLRVTGKGNFSGRSYDAVIAAGEKHGFLHLAALACEYATAYYSAAGRHRFAAVYLRDALRFYGDWGSGLKVAYLSEKYSNLLPADISHGNEPTGDISAALDLHSVMKSAQALSSEIRLDKLLKTMMQIVLTNAGAGRGIYLLMREGQLFIEASSRAGDEDVSILQKIPFDASDDLAQSVVRFVRHSQESVMLHDARREGDFINDPYIQNHDIKSLLCMPVLYQGSLRGVLYLENNLATNAFTHDRIELLNILTREMAISIENALLYEELQQVNRKLEEYNRSLEDKVKERTEDLRRRGDDLSAANQQLEDTLANLQKTQNQLVQSEKLVSLGQLTAGIAHELKNPLNFITNFSQLSGEYLSELEELLRDKHDLLNTADFAEVNELLEILKTNSGKISDHGKRADGIIRSMMMHARGTSGQKEVSDINRLLEESVNLVYHGMRAQNPDFNIDIHKSFADHLPLIEVVPQDLSRVFLNIINNAFYAAYAKNRAAAARAEVSSYSENGTVCIHIRDNGDGIPQAIQEKMFTPFQTSKPAGEGTGLGLSISHDIIRAHKGTISFETENGKFTEFIIRLPVNSGVVA